MGAVWEDVVYDKARYRGDIPYELLAVVGAGGH